MSRPLKSTDGLPRVQVTATIDQQNADFVSTTLLRLRARHASSTRSDALNSIVEFAKVRRFDPIAGLKKILPPPSTAAGGKPATKR